MEETCWTNDGLTIRAFAIDVYGERLFVIVANEDDMHLSAVRKLEHRFAYAVGYFDGFHVVILRVEGSRIRSALKDALDVLIGVERVVDVDAAFVLNAEVDDVASIGIAVLYNELEQLKVIGWRTVDELCFSCMVVAQDISAVL